MEKEEGWIKVHIAVNNHPPSERSWAPENKKHILNALLFALLTAGFNFSRYFVCYYKLSSVIYNYI